MSSIREPAGKHFLMRGELTARRHPCFYASMLEVRYYLTEDGRSPFAEWFSSLDRVARAKVAAALVRIGQGNLSNVKPVSGGVLEYKVNFGPGYRIYLGRDGEAVVILLVGGTKKRQQRDIEAAIELWRAYRREQRHGD
jgi:putative addiction module killer protein